MIRKHYLNEQRVVKRFALFPYVYERGFIWLQWYYLLQDWHKGIYGGFGWNTVEVVPKEAYLEYKADPEKFNRELLYRKYYRR